MKAVTGKWYFIFPHSVCHWLFWSAGFYYSDFPIRWLKYLACQFMIFKVTDSVQLDTVPLSPEDDRLGIWVHRRSLWYLMSSLSGLASGETLHCFLKPCGTRTWQASGICCHLGPQNPLAVFLLFSKCSGSRAPVDFNSPVPQADKGQNLTATLRWQNSSIPTPTPIPLEVNGEAEHCCELSHSLRTFSVPVSC